MLCLCFDHTGFQRWFLRNEFTFQFRSFYHAFFCSMLREFMHTFMVAITVFFWISQRNSIVLLVLQNGFHCLPIIRSHFNKTNGLYGSNINRWILQSFHAVNSPSANPFVVSNHSRLSVKTGKTNDKIDGTWELIRSKFMTKCSSNQASKGIHSKWSLNTTQLILMTRSIPCLCRKAKIIWLWGTEKRR